MQDHVCTAQRECACHFGELRIPGDHHAEPAERRFGHGEQRFAAEELDPAFVDVAGPRLG
jgi:hypothetical protein